MTDRFSPTDVHAYVDECLPREARVAFESRLREDPELRRRVDLWQAQNDAIRAAFRAPPRPRGPLSIGRPSNENGSPPAPSEPEGRRARTAETSRDAPSPSPRTAPADAMRAGAQSMETRRKWARTVRAALILCLSSFFVTLSPAGGPPDNLGPLMEAAMAAYRAFAADPNVALDIVASDPRSLTRQLSPKFSADPAAMNLNATGWTLIGMRFVPGTASAAAFVLWENRDRVRLGLLIEPLDAPAASDPRRREAGGAAVVAWTEKGEGYAAVGPDMRAVRTLMQMREARRPLTAFMR